MYLSTLGYFTYTSLIILDVKSDETESLLERMNEDVITRMNQYTLPSVTWTTIKNEHGDDMNVKMFLPRGFDPNASQKYPVLMRV